LITIPSRDRYDQYLTRATAFNSKTGIMSRSSDANLGRNDSDEIATIGAVGDLNLAGMRHEVYVGGEYERQRSFRGDTIRGKAVSGFDLYDPVYGTLSTGGTASASQSDSLSKVHTYSLITQDTIHLTDHLIAVGGVRWENWQQLSGVGRPFVIADHSHGQVWMPQFGLVYKLTPALSAYANFSKSFVPNVATEVSEPLAPERGRVYEAGLKFETKIGKIPTRVQLNVKNVFDKTYYPSSSSNLIIAVGEARLVMLNTTFSF
jgi:iron complex outermembrane recepter protein